MTSKRFWHFSSFKIFGFCINRLIFLIDLEIIGSNLSHHLSSTHLQVKGIAESAAKSTDELLSHTKKSLDDITGNSSSSSSSGGGASAQQMACWGEPKRWWWPGRQTPGEDAGQQSLVKSGTNEKLKRVSSSCVLGLIRYTRVGWVGDSWVKPFVESATPTPINYCNECCCVAELRTCRHRWLWSVRREGRVDGYYLFVASWPDQLNDGGRCGGGGEYFVIIRNYSIGMGTGESLKLAVERMRIEEEHVRTVKLQILASFLGIIFQLRTTKTMWRVWGMGYREWDTIQLNIWYRHYWTVREWGRRKRERGCLVLKHSLWWSGAEENGSGGVKG